MANKIYINPETARTWSDASTSSDELLDLGGLAADAVAMGSFWDRGAAPYSEWAVVELFIDGFDTAPVVGEAVHLYISQSDGTTDFDGRPTTDPTDTVQGTMTVNQLRNVKYALSCIVVSTTAADNLQARGVVRLTERYVSPAIHNDAADALLGTSDAHMITITPIPPEIQ